MITVAEQSLKENYFALFAAITGEMTVREACKIMNISPVKKSGKRGSYNTRDLTDEELEKVIEMKANGATWKEIGKEFEINRGTVFQKVKKYMGDEWESRSW